MRITRMLTLILLLLLLLPACALCEGGQISGVAWNDVKHDYHYEEGDDTLRGVVIRLYRQENGGETLVSKLTTGNNGLYQFGNLPAGEYRLDVTLPDKFLFVEPTQGSSIILPAVGQESTSAKFTLDENQVLDQMHIGASKGYTYIRIIAFEDANLNGGRMSSEKRLRGAVIHLMYEYNGEMYEIASGKTDKEGILEFWPMAPGTYRLAATLPESYIIGPLGEKVSGFYNVIIPADSNYGLSEPFTLKRDTSMAFGVGAALSGQMQGCIWYDANSNGARDANETGYAGAVVSIANEAAGVSRTMKSDENGNYAFDLLAEGEYQLSVTLPEDVMFTLPDGDSLLTNGYSFTQSTLTTVNMKETTVVPDIGVMPLTALDISVYNDINANGLHDEGEPPFAGATLNIIVGGDALLSAQSDGDGMVRIPVLRGGDMTLQLSLPDGQVFTIAGDDNTFHALTAKNTIALPVTLPHGETTRMSAGVTLPAGISGTLFNDENISGLPDENENGLQGFTVQAVNAEQKVVAETTTDENGHYAFDSLLPAAHSIRFCLPDAYVFSDYSDADVENRNQVISQTVLYGETAALSLAPGQQVESICGGAFRSATISGQVLLSAGKAAQQLSGGMENVLIELVTKEGFPLSDELFTYTKADGSFYLKGALPGSYRVQVTLPDGCIFTEPLLDDYIYSSPIFTLGIAQDLVFPTFSAVPSGSIDGVLYYDSNISGQYDAGETIFKGAHIRLRNTDYDMTYETRTMDDGSFGFHDLRPGAYTISLTVDEGLCFAHDASSLIPASTLSSTEAQFILLAGQHLNGSNIAVSAPASLTGTLYFDTLNNNVQDADDLGAGGITVVLQSADALHSYTAITDENGAFTLSPIVAGNYHLLVSLTSDCIPADGNPAQLVDGFYLSDIRIEDGENAATQYAILRYAGITGRIFSVDGQNKGVSGRTVTLYDADGIALGYSTSDENGVYSFGSLKPGSYTLACDLPDNTYQFARLGGEGDQHSCITHGEDGKPVCEKIIVPMGESVATRIGIGTPGTIGDIAWLDENGNGLLDAGEPGLPGIEIALYLYGNKVAETVTDGYGHYQFKGIFPGDYAMKVTMPKEVRATVKRTDFPLLSSILPETKDTIIEFDGVIVPSGSRNLNCDLGFVLVKKGVYPASMDNLPSIDWNLDK